MRCTASSCAALSFGVGARDPILTFVHGICVEFSPQIPHETDPPE
jgi:hypothetical protein